MSTNTNIRLLALVTLLGASLNADTITWGTAVPGTIESNTATVTDVVSDMAPAWHVALGSSQWESIQQNPLLPAIPDGQVEFTFIFYMEGEPSTGAIGVMVDDSASGFLNGHQLFSDIGSPQQEHCAQAKPNCTDPLWMDVSQYLIPGLNRLEVTVSQDVPNTYFGIDLYGVAYTSSTVPEPATVLLIGSGLLIVGARKRRRGVQ